MVKMCVKLTTTYWVIQGLKVYTLVLIIITELNNTECGVDMF